MKFKFFTFFLLFTGLLSCNSTQKNSLSPDIVNNSVIDFKWSSFEQDSIRIEHGAMYVPVRLEGIEKEFDMQFDLGLDVNAIYGNPLKTLATRYPELEDKINKGEGYTVLKTNTFLDNNRSNVDSLFIIPNYGQSIDYEDLQVIGSIGANEIANKILILDFPSQTMEIKDSIERREVGEFEFVPLEFRNNKIILTVTVSSLTQKYIFDTGASITPITTIDPEFFDLVKGNAEPVDTLYLNSWGKKEAFIAVKIKRPLKMSGAPINTENKNIYLTQATSIVKTMDEIGVKGLIGNDLFIDDIIMIDLVNNRFGIRN